jgi:hypothetical protein
MKIITVIILSLNLLQIHAQENPKNTEWMDFLEELYMTEDADPASIEQLYDDLSYISERPFNLRTVTRKELERLPFLSSIQIENLLYYVYRFDLVDIYELKNVKSLDFVTINLLLPFVYVGEAKKTPLNLKNTLPHVKHDVILRTGYTLQQKAGYKKSTEEDKAARPNKYYLGNPYYMSLRYGFRTNDDIQFGFAGEKDAGESFWNKHHKGFDHYTFNLNLKNRGILEDLHIGDYRLSFGQGLAMNTNFIMGKTTFITNIAQMNEGIKRHATTDENNYFSGAAASLKINNLQFTCFGSHRLHDANADSLTVFSFKNDGYNRTLNDMEKRNSATVNTGGGHIRWRTESVNIGLTAVYYSFAGKQLNPKRQPYNIFYLRAKDFFNTGINYGMHGKWFAFQGETAIDRNSKFATVNNLLLNPSSLFDLAISYRSYARDYNAFYARAFSESSTVSNESGFYFGWKIYLSTCWELSGYIDCFKFPWFKYGIDSPSEGSESVQKMTFKPNDKWELQARHKYKSKSKNKNKDYNEGSETFVKPYYQDQWQFRITTDLNNCLQLKTRVDYSRYTFLEILEKGWFISETLSWSPKYKFHIDACAGYYDTGGYNTRISVYEKSLLNAFSFPSFYGEGFRMYMVVRWNVSMRASVCMKIGNTRYFDRTTISSDLEAIEGRDKTDISCLLKCNF